MCYGDLWCVAEFAIEQYLTRCGATLFFWGISTLMRLLHHYPVVLLYTCPEEAQPALTSIIGNGEQPDREQGNQEITEVEASSENLNEDVISLMVLSRLKMLKSIGAPLKVSVPTKYLHKMANQ